MMHTYSKQSRRACRPGLLLLVGVLALWLAAPASRADSCGQLSRGQTLYVPAYSHIYSGDREQPIYLAVTLSIRNTDAAHAIKITKVTYYDSDGQMIKRYLTTPVTLKPLSTTRYVIKESDKGGGSGANFIVAWQAERPVVAPLIETVMISTRHTLGISFTSRGRVIGPGAP